ncbi:MAG: hypothetical protein HZB55_12060 [Deltaproteobacteria bacterium]|nr:hypothetical protein [Deltaproteobacteria bacterium]
MKTKTGVFAVLSALFLASGTAGAQMMGGMMGEGHGMMGGPMAEMVGPGFAGACSADLGNLGLSPDAQKSLEEKRFELRKKTIRGTADLQVLKLELAHLLENRAFALPTAEKIVGEMSQKEGELHSAHLAFLQHLASMLSNDQ